MGFGGSLDTGFLTRGPVKRESFILGGHTPPFVQEIDRSGVGLANNSQYGGWTKPDSHRLRCTNPYAYLNKPPAKWRRNLSIHSVTCSLLPRNLLQLVWALHSMANIYFWLEAMKGTPTFSKKDTWGPSKCCPLVFASNCAWTIREICYYYLFATVGTTTLGHTRIFDQRTFLFPQ